MKCIGEERWLKSRWVLKLAKKILVKSSEAVFAGEGINVIRMSE